MTSSPFMTPFIITAINPYDSTLDDFFAEGFKIHATSVGRDANWSAFAFEARDSDGIRIGAIDGNTLYRALNIKRLVVVAASQRHGVGSALMQAALACGIERSCVMACVETFSVQAPEFYKRFGFICDLERHGYADDLGDVSFLHFTKRLE